MLIEGLLSMLKFLLSIIAIISILSTTYAQKINNCGFPVAQTSEDFQKILYSIQEKNIECLKNSQDSNDINLLANLYIHELLGFKKDNKISDNLLMESAKKGNFIAQYDYALILLLKGDITAGIHYLELSSIAGYPTAKNRLGMSYLAIGKKDEGIKWIEKAAEDNDAFALNNLAIFYFQGILVEQDINKAVNLFIQSAELGNAQAQMIVGGFYTGKVINEIQENQELAFKWTKMSVDSGNNGSLNNLAEFYRKGYGTDVNLHKAFELMTLSSDQEDAFGQFNLGAYYEYGVGTSINREKALELYQQVYNLNPNILANKCTNQRDLQCYKNSALELLNLFLKSDKAIYKSINSIGMKPDIEAYILKASQGDAQAQYDLAVIYDQGINTPINPKEAYKWYLLSAENKNMYGQYALGFLYENGINVSKDQSMAIKWYTLSAEQNYVFAQFNLGAIYLAINDYEDSLKWFLKAAEQGLDQAQYITGIFYDNGIGTKKDTASAVQWWMLSAEQNYGYAQYALGEYYQAEDRNKSLKWYEMAQAQGIGKNEYDQFNKLILP